MSTGHRHQEAPAVARRTLEQILRDPAVMERLYKPHEINNDYDIPYIAGYSKDGKTIYFDRHLPEQVALELDGHKKIIEPRNFIRHHEALEKAIIDALDWGYFQAHAVATAWEKRHVLEDLGPQWWMPYTHSMDGYAKAEEHESVKSVPKDLDMTPYQAPPVNHRLLEAMRKAQGGKAKSSRDSVNYTDNGRPSEHCGPVKTWPRGECEHFRSPSTCECVSGKINPKGWCELWAAYES